MHNVSQDTHCVIKVKNLQEPFNSSKSSLQIALLVDSFFPSYFNSSSLTTLFWSGSHLITAAWEY